MNASSYDLLEFRLEDDSGESDEERSTHESEKYSEYFPSVRYGSHISISYGRHGYGSEVEWMEEVPAFDEMET